MSPEPYACISWKKDGIPKSVKSHVNSGSLETGYGPSCEDAIGSGGEHTPGYG